MDLNYYKTLIAVADDCPVETSVVPRDPSGAGKKKTVAALQYELLADHPYVHTQEDVLFQTWLQRQDLPELSADEVAQLRADFFARPQACLRASPLPKKYGFGFLFDDKGRIALCPRESKEYQEHLSSGRVKVVKAMRTSRA
jgi:hypothetical protein